MLIDFHIHSNTSSDSDMTIKEIYERAVELGIKDICITNHHEPCEIKKGDHKQSMTDKELENTKKQIAKLKKDGRVRIWLGIEMSYTEEDEEDIRQYLSTNAFDFVLGSVHYAAGHNLANRHTRDRLKDVDHEPIRKEYLRLLKKAIKSRLFDIMSHLDLYKKSISEVPFDEDKHEWIDVANNLLNCGVGFEINTGRGKHIYPSAEILRLLVEKGVKLITIGSDSHKTEEIGEGIDKAEKMLEELGVKTIYRFEKRKPIPIDLNTCKPELRT
jgi:histidinol-phosphatase (PHP family)